jgi:hypothetical protein
MHFRERGYGFAQAFLQAAKTGSGKGGSAAQLQDFGHDGKEKTGIRKRAIIPVRS